MTPVHSAATREETAATCYRSELIFAMHPIYLIEGPVGSGKSTFARKVAAQQTGAHLALDEWFARLYSADRPRTDFLSWYMERKDRLVDALWNHALTLTKTGITAVLELGLIQRQAREEIYTRAREANVELKIFVLDAPIEVRWDRVQRRNQERGSTFSMVVPEQVFNMASELWEMPDDFEILENQIQVIAQSEQ